MLLSIFDESSRLQVVWSYSELTEEQENEKVGNSQNLLNNLHSFDLSRRNILMEREFSFITNKDVKQFFVTRISLKVFADLSENLFLIMRIRREIRKFSIIIYKKTKILPSFHFIEILHLILQDSSMLNCLYSSNIWLIWTRVSNRIT